MKKHLWHILTALLLVCLTAGVAAACRNDEPTPKTYTVTYVGGEGTTGTAPAGGKYKEGAEITVADEGTLEKEDNTFAGWNDGDKTYAAGAKYTMPAKDVTFTAQWTPDSTEEDTYEITFSVNGHVARYGVSVVQGEAIGTQLPDPADLGDAGNIADLIPYGKVLTGWATSEGGTAIDGTWIPTEDTVLYALLGEGEKITLAYAAGEGTGTQTAKETETTRFEESGWVLLPECNYTATGKVFGYWTVGSGENAQNFAATAYANLPELETFAVDGTVTFTAHWLTQEELDEITGTLTLQDAETNPTKTQVLKGVAGDNIAPATFVFPACPFTAPAGKAFSHWEYMAVEYEPGVREEFPKKGTAVAIWEDSDTPATKYTVTFDKNAGGDNTVSGMPANATNVEAGEYTIPDEEPTRTGYDFLGWTLNANGEGTVYKKGGTNTKLQVSDNVTLYAKWVQVFSITFNGNGDSVTNLPDNVEKIAKGTTYTIPDKTPVYTGYDFVGWTTDQGGTGDVYKHGDSAHGSIVVDANITFYAKWTETTPETYTVTYDPNAPAGKSDTDVKKMPAAASNVKGAYTIPDDEPELNGYAFKGWTTDEAGAQTLYKKDGDHKTLQVNDNVTLYAQWVQVFSITYDPNAPEGKSDSDVQKMPEPLTEGNLKTGDTYTVSTTEPTLDGYDFKGWTTDKNGTGTVYKSGTDNNTVTIADADITLYAKWEKQSEPAVKHTVTLNANAGSDNVEGMPEPAMFSVDEGEYYTIPNVTLTRANYDFKGWTTEANAESPIYKYNDEQYGRILVNDDITLYAKWESTVVEPETHEYTVKFWETKDEYTGSPKGTKTFLIADNVPITDDTEYVLGPIEKANYTFKGWYFSDDIAYQAGFVPSDHHTEYVINVYATWELDDEITVESITTTNFTNNEPPYVYPEKLKEGEILTLASDNMQFSDKENSTSIEWRGIHFYLTDGAPAAGALSGNWAMLLYNNFINGTDTTTGKLSATNALHFTVVNDYIGFPDTDYWWVESLREIMTKGTNISLKAVLDFSTKTRIMVEYTLTANFKAWHSDGGDPAKAVQYDTEATKSFVSRYYITPASGNTLASEYTVAVGGEKASVMTVTLKRTAHTHNFGSGLYCNGCGAINPEHSHNYVNGLCACGAISAETEGFTAANWSKATTGFLIAGEKYDVPQTLEAGHTMFLIGTQTSNIAADGWANWHNLCWELRDNAADVNGYTGRTDNFGWSFGTSPFSNWNAPGDPGGQHTGTSSNVKLATCAVNNNKAYADPFNADVFKQIVKNANWYLEIDYTENTRVLVTLVMSAIDGPFQGATYTCQVQINCNTAGSPAAIKVDIGADANVTYSVTGYKVV